MGGKSNNAPSDKQMTRMAGPWFPLQDTYKDLIPQIKNANQENWQYGPEVVQDLDPASQALLKQGINFAGTNAAGAQGNINFANSVGSGGFMNTPGMDAVNNTAINGIDNPTYQALLANFNQAQAGSGGLDYAQKVASGGMLGSNPYIDQVVNNSVADANRTLLPALEGRMSMAGRMGSNAEAVGQGEIAKKLGEVASGIRYGDYQNERQMQQAAGMALPSLLGQEIGVKNAAAGAVSDDLYQRLGIQLGAAQQAGNMTNANINTALQAGGAGGNMANNAQSLLASGVNLGQIDQQNRQNQAQEARDMFQYNQSGTYDRINRMLAQYGQINGVANPALANQAYAQSLQGPSSGQQTFGNILSAAGLAAGIGATFMTGGAAAPALAAAGAGLTTAGQAVGQGGGPRGY